MRSRLSLLALATALACHGAARADEKAELQQLRATTLALIEALVQQGLISRDRADALLKQAAAPQWGAPPKPPVAAAPAAPVVRVPYLPESVKAEIKQDITREMLATTRAEGWADPRTLPSWLRGVTLSGDLRVRAERQDFDEPRYADPADPLCAIVGGNLPAACYRAQAGTPAWSPDLSNTTVDRDRLTLRARLGVEAKVSDDTLLGIRLATGTGSGPTSSSLTLGSSFNKLGVVLDRAWLRWEPRHDLRVLAGRMPNPFFGSDLLWPDDLGFDGLALQGEVTLMPGAFAFGTVGAFPLQEFSAGRDDKWLYALQVGADWALSDHTTLRLGLGVYEFRNVEGVRETEPAPTGALAGTTDYFDSQYPSALRLKGNTLIALNDPSSTAAPVWGLASKYKPINLSAQLAMRLDDFHRASLHLDWVKNGGFDLADIQRRAGSTALADLAEQTTGSQIRFSVGRGGLAETGDWQFFGAWRKFERDAWIDGFTDTTWHGGGGTNYQGWQIGGQYAFDRRTTLGLRATSSRNLDDGQPNLSSAPLKVDTWQLDLSTRF